MMLRTCVAVAAVLLMGAPTAAAALPAASDASHEAGGCGILQETVCWTKTFGCNMVRATTNETPPQCGHWPPKRPGTISYEPVGMQVVDLTQDGGCYNAGVIVMVTVIGVNRYCTGGPCENDGIIVMVGYSYSCHGEGYGTVCVDDECVVGPRRPHDTRPVPTLVAETLPMIA